MGFCYFLVFSEKKLIILFYLMILWQSGFDDFIFQSTAQSAGVLSDSEVLTFNFMMEKLKPKDLSRISKDDCKSDRSKSTNPIRCTGCTKGSSCRISELQLSNNQLSGTIDDAIGDLTGLTDIDLSSNSLQGPITSRIGSLTNLRSLDLSDNQLTGMIPPSIGSLLSLNYLDLDYNFLKGSIPSSLGDTSLTIMSLEFNSLSGSIPPSLGKLHNLTELYLSENELSGSLPEELGNLTNLTDFWAASNYFEERLPNGYKNLNKLESFVVSGNGLRGPLPDIVNWTSINTLLLQGNNFDGPVPDVYFEMESLDSLSISDLLGTSETKFPDAAQFPKISTLVLRRCSLSGPMPAFIGELSELQYLDLSFNNLTGGLPESIIPTLVYFSVARNKLNGTIPNWIFQASGTRMDLSFNNFSELEKAVAPDLDLNLFSCCCCNVSEGATQPYMLQLTDMRKIYSPEEKKPKFQSLYINCGGGPTQLHETPYEEDNITLPFYMSPGQNWAYTFSGDFFSDSINSSAYIKNISSGISNSEPDMYNDARLSPVSLDYYAFNLYKGSYNVTLHFAEIIYSEMQDYGTLKKRIFDIYIQSKREKYDFDIRDYAGGPNKAISLTFEAQVDETGLLNIHLYWAGKGSQFSPSFNGPLISAISVDPLFKIGAERLAVWKIALISLASFFLVLLILLAIAWTMGLLENKELKKKVKVGEHTSSDEGTKEDITVTLKTLVKATGKFSDEKKLGDGYLGAVYKADVMESPKITVAVKKIYQRHKGKIRSAIQNEIYLLKTLEGQNIIKLLDVHIGQTLQLFIYEYMEKRSLETALFESKVGTFLWRTRFEICKGIARGLASLHQRSTRVVHGNLKASNILLDKQNNPKLSDFGYAGIYNDEDKYTLIKQRGPSGILAPEYCQGRDNALSTKTDVYSFGVILIEIVAGHGNKESTGTQESVDLIDKVHLHFRGKRPSITGFIDKRLQGDKELNEREVELVLELAVMCTATSPSQRPWIDDVLSVLNSEKDLGEIRALEDSSLSNEVTRDTAKSTTS